MTTCDPGRVGQVPASFRRNQYGCDSLVITQTVLLPSNTPDPAAVYLRSAGGWSGYLLFGPTTDVTARSSSPTIHTGTYQATAHTVRSLWSGSIIWIPGGDSGPCDSPFICNTNTSPDTTWLTGPIRRAVSQAGNPLCRSCPTSSAATARSSRSQPLQPSDATGGRVTRNKAGRVHDAQTLTNQWEFVTVWYGQRSSISG